ncbi:MAG TPA: M4 family metallopeptidase [Thermomonospora sp.]|nr:M4 family metallopeptidase [Thermomonospora sp.]
MRHRTAWGAVAIAGGLVVAMSAPAGAQAPGAPALPAKPDPRQVAAAAADRLVAAKPKPFRASPRDRIVRTGVVPGAGGLQHVVYQRTYAGLPVHGGDFVVSTDRSGAVLSTSVNQSRPLSVSTKPKVTAASAAKTARRLLPTVDRTSAPRLLVLAEGTGRLAYEVVVTGSKQRRPSVLHVFVDAGTGRVVQSWDDVRAADDQSFYHGGQRNPVEIATSGSGGQYSMSDPGRPGISCANQSGTVYTGTDNVWGNAGGTNLETACVDALYAAAKEFDMAGTWLGRRGLDGNGRGWPMRVGLNQANAYWNGSYANFGRNSAGTKQVTPTDVVAHELGHGIFQFTPGGSGGSNEKGGLNESTGDIFGALTEWYINEPRVQEQMSGTTAVVNYDPPDYLVGEEVDLVGSGPIRNMYQPSLVNNDPNCYSSSVPSMEVHKAAGVQNHWFYLLAEGSNANDPNNGRPNSPTCNGSTLTGIGVQKAGLIFMETLNLKTSTWTHSLARRASLQATLNLVQVGKATCTDFTRVRDAWNAVSVPAASGEPTTCTGGGNDFSLSLNPSSGSTQPGQPVNVTVGTQTTSGSAQQVTLSATSQPSGPTASFSPNPISSGQSSTMTVTVPAGTPDGRYTLTVLADGAQVDRTATFTLTVGTPGPGDVFSDDFETDKGWTVNPGGTDTGTAGLFQRGTPQATSYSGTNLQLTAAGGGYDLVTGASAGADAGANDLDGGTTSIQSPAITLPSGTLTLSFSWYLGHLNNASSADYLRVRVVGTTTTTVLNQTGAATNRSAAWQTATVDISAHAGQTVRILVDAADASTGSLVEAGIDNVRITGS